jgi:thiosulfate/3-mercaptopyruvate sulfurtransferase
LIDTADLARRLGTAGLRVVDASWYLPQTARDARAEYRSGHIPGAVSFDLDTHSDPATSLPHMLPSAESFARGMSGLGLSDEDLIVVYDGSGANLSAARVWWMFRAFGHPQVAVLDGGLGRWQGEGRPLETGDVTPSPGRFHATLDPARVRSLEAVRDAVAAGRAQLVDARSRGRFEDPSPSRGPGCAAVMCRAAATCPTLNWSMPTALSGRRPNCGPGLRRRESTLPARSLPAAVRG